MKKIYSTILILLTIALIGYLGYVGIKVGIPYLTTKTEYSQHLPTIEKQQQEIDSLIFQVDSLNGVVSQIINASNLKTALMKNISENNKALQRKYEKLSDIFARVPESELDAFIDSFNQ